MPHPLLRKVYPIEFNYKMYESNRVVMDKFLSFTNRQLKWENDS